MAAEPHVPGTVEALADGYEALTAYVAETLLDLPDEVRARRAEALRGVVECRYGAAQASRCLDDVARQWIDLRRRLRLSVTDAAAEHAADGYAAWLAGAALSEVRRLGAYLRAEHGDALADALARALATPAERARDAALAASARASSARASSALASSARASSARASAARAPPSAAHAARDRAMAALLAPPRTHAPT